MQAHEIMIQNVHTVKENDTVRTVIEKFIDHRISGLPIIDHDNKMIAYISDGDIMRFIGKHRNLFMDAIFFVQVIQDAIKFNEKINQILELNVMSLSKKKVHTVQWNEEIENIAAILASDCKDVVTQVICCQVCY